MRVDAVWNLLLVFCLIWSLFNQQERTKREKYYLLHRFLDEYTVFRGKGGKSSLYGALVQR